MNHLKADHTTNTSIEYSMYNKENHFFIDSELNNDKIFVLKLNYEKFFNSSYEEIIEKSDLFHASYSLNNYNKKLLIIIDVSETKKCLKNNDTTNGLNLIYESSLFKVSNYINKVYDKNIYKCVLINYKSVDKTLIFLLKQLFKKNKFIQKIELYLQNS